MAKRIHGGELSPRKLLDLKRRIGRAEQEYSKLTGIVKYLKEQLGELGCSSVEEAQEKVGELEDNIARLTKKIESKSSQIQAILEGTEG